MCVVVGCMRLVEGQLEMSAAVDATGNSAQPAPGWKSICNKSHLIKPQLDHQQKQTPMITLHGYLPARLPEHRRKV